MATARSGESADAESGPVVVDGTIHSPKEILRLLEESALKYTIEVLDTVVVDSIIATLPLVAPTTVPVDTDEGPVLGRMQLPENLADRMAYGDSLFDEKQYDEALVIYQDLLDSFPETFIFATLVGDTHWSLNQLDSAEYWLLRSLELNPISYQTHWFLADTYRNQGRLDLALKHCYLAHLYNRNHRSIKNRLRQLREQAGRPWKEWSFYPVYRMSQSGDTVNIALDSETMGYALTKALWQFEPGYAERMAADDNVLARDVNLLEEREAVSTGARELADTIPVEEMADRGEIDLFIVYEIITRRDPEFALWLDERTINQLIEYLDTYH